MHRVPSVSKQGRIIQKAKRLCRLPGMCKTIWMSFLMLMLSGGLNAQNSGVYIPGSAAMYIPANTSIGIWGDTLLLKGNLYMHDSSSAVYFRGKTWKNDPMAVIKGGKVIMNATSLQAIVGRGSYGMGPSFSRLEIDNPAGVYLLDSHVRVDSQLVFSKGILFAGANDILLSVPATASEQTDSSFASVYETGGVSKFFNSNSSFTFPVGISYPGLTYNPLKLDVHASSYNSASYVRVNMNDSVHAQKTPRHLNYGTKYWSVKFNSITIDSATYTAMYNAADSFVGDKSKITGSDWANSKWSYKSTGRIPGVALGITGKLLSNADILGQDVSTQADIKTILQGAWNGTTMTTALRASNLVPLSQPYGAAPYNVAGFNYFGTENRTTLPANVVDWVLLELRSTPTGPTVGRSVGLILNDGTIVDGYTNGPLEFQDVSEGKYYVVVKHRNHLPVMSAAPVSLPNSSVYDFTTAMSKGYGSSNPMADMGGGKYGLYGGNVIPDARIRGSGAVAVNDINKIDQILGTRTNSLSNVYNPADVNLDGKVRASGAISVNDYNKLIAFLGSLTTIINQTF
jgi:hypothetical protein